ncbi:MAG: hypothetical protein F4Z25_09325 [Chloroflexi bacterium]|nr:hypothetical protein [Chloroflexota bacterium]
MSDFDARTEELEQLSLPEVEEAIGEIQRRIAVALRALGERAADEPDATGRPPRLAVAELAAQLELAALALAPAGGGGAAAHEGGDRTAPLAAALMYAAPTIPALLQRLDQDRRLLVSLARAAEEHPAPEDAPRPRRLLVESGLEAAARCAMALEAALERHAEDAEPEAEASGGP